MAENTKIQWADHTFNPWIGCSKVNEGCRFCYAENLMDHRYGRVQWGPNGTRSRTKTWNDPLRWNKESARTGRRAKVFCASLADIFEDHPALTEWRKDLFNLIDQCQNLFWLLLTKRPENIRRFWQQDYEGFPYRRRNNVWLGTSIATQGNADEFVPRLLELRDLCPILFLSVEPQISQISLGPWVRRLDWVICGGESQQGSVQARPFHIEWGRSLLSQCREAYVPFFLKQLGSNVWHLSQPTLPLKLKDSHGGDWYEWPGDLMVRECPETYFAERKAV